MKKLIVMIMTLICAVSLNAQEKFNTYENQYNGKTYDISVGFNDKGTFDLYIDALSLDDSHETGGIIINTKRYEDFLIALRESKIKFQEWSEIANKNNVTDLEKTMSMTVKSSAYFLYGRDWQFDFLVPLQFDFRVLEIEKSIKHYLIIRTNELTSSSNQYMQVDGFILVFESITDIDNFINVISIEKINEFKNKPKTEEMFK